MEPNGPSSSNLALQAKFLKSKKIKDFGLYLSNIWLTYSITIIFFLPFLGDHFRIEQKRTIQCQLLDYFTGWVAMVLIKRHTNHRNDVIDGSPITQRPCPFHAHGKNATMYLALKIGAENCKHNGCILQLENEDTINIVFDVFSTDERGNIICRFIS